MLKRLPELIISGIVLYFSIKELLENTREVDRLQNNCAQKEMELANLKNESRGDREEIRGLHYQFIEIVSDRNDLYKAYTELIEQVEEIGFSIDEKNKIVFPMESAEDVKALEDILGEEDEES